MTDSQILTMAIAIVFPVLGVIGAITAVIYSNKRIDGLGSRFDDFKKEISDKIDNGFDHMALLLKLHEAEHHKK